jgi:RNA polymerase sigma-70 factor (ECF subfamily)
MSRYYLGFNRNRASRHLERSPGVQSPGPRRRLLTGRPPNERRVSAMSDQTRIFLDETLPYLDLLYRVARNAGQDHHRAEDIVQETYLRAYAAFDQRRGDNTRAWMVSICLNLIRSDARRRLRRVVEAPFFDGAEVEATGAGVPDEAIARLDREAVSSALTRLPRDQRLAIVLMDLAGLTASEAAAALGCPRNTVLSWVHRGRKRLAALLVEQDLSRDLP